jgi:hypothetical protein
MSGVKETETLGGKRERSGRPKGEPTKALGLRVPVRYHKQLTEMVRNEVKRLQALKTS